MEVLQLSHDFKIISLQTMLIFVIFVLGLTSAIAKENSICCSRPDAQRFVYRIAEHACPCDSHAIGTLRYHDNKIQFCNGVAYVNVGGHELGSIDNPAKSCGQIAYKESGLYYIQTGDGVTKTYCYMEEICGSKGWAMVMKIDGSKTTFSYESGKWKDQQVYNEEAASGGLDNQETKLRTYSNLPFNKLCLGMKTNGKTSWLLMEYEARSLYSLIHDNKYRPTKLGRDAWKSLILDSSLQKNCNKEGFNVYHKKDAMARIGIIANQEKDCNSPDSRIGFGTQGNNCNQDNKNSAGNEARCSPDNGDRSIKGFGYIFAQ